MLSTLLQGLLVGFAYVMPIGMENLFVINSAIANSRARALATALIVVLFDMSLTLACFFGVGAVMDVVPGLSRIIQLVGGVLVMAIGIGLVLPKRAGKKADSSPVGRDAKPDAETTGGAAKPAAPDGAPPSPVATTSVAPAAGLGKTLAAVFVVTWCNPQALLDGTMMLGAFRATFSGADGIAFVAGACIAALVWFPALALAVNALGSRFSDKMLRVVNVVCGCVVVLYGARLVAAFFGLAL